jgi:Flp pilus assembly protein TadD
MLRPLVLLCIALAAVAASAQSTNLLSVVIEAAGRVEFNSGGGTNWQPARAGAALKPGDRIRTHEQSRAAVQLSDRSVIRLNERTTLEILLPRRAEKKRFGLPGGSIFFFNREKPADVEFDTPLAAGAIRGTEFLLEVRGVAAGVPPALEPGVPPGGKRGDSPERVENLSAGSGGRMLPSAAGGTPAATFLHLALIDGLVSLQTADGEVNLQRGQDLRLVPNQPPQKTALVNVNAAIQWALYYPAVVNPAELPLDAADRTDLAEVLNSYRSGDLLAALAAWPSTQSDTGAGRKILHAQLELAVGGVNEAQRLLDGVPDDQSTAAALRELIRVVLGNTDTNASADLPGSPASSSQLLARSYALQANANLEAARAAATQSVQFAPDFGFAHARLAELDFAFGNRRAALAELDVALRLSPRLAPGHSLRGFAMLAQGDVSAALNSFDRARELDAAFGLAWLGRGLCLMQERKFSEALCAFQAAAALEPQRSLYRSYLGKASSELGNRKGAQKEFNLAKRLDPNDPTPWLYSALDLWEQNRLNEAIRDLEKSINLNDQLTPFRSRLLLDGDRSVRGADIAAIYDDAGLPEVSKHMASQSVAEDYANFSGHLFLANSYQTVEDANQYDLRLETARQSELLVANLLAPPGAGNLSQLFSQQEHLQYFDPRPVGVSSFTGYGSGGDWVQTVTLFGSLDGFSYALDSSYQSLNGQQPNGSSESRQYILTMKQRVTPDDDFYFQAGYLKSDAGDVALHYDPTQTTPGFHVEEKQEPTLYAGWHHAWSPGSHTLLLVGRLNDNLTLRNPDENILFLLTGLFGGPVQQVQSSPLVPPVDLNFTSDFTLYSAELQHIWETPRYSLVVGGRWQSGNVDSHATMTRSFPATDFPVTDQNVSSDLQRRNAYAYGSWQVFDPLRLIAGVSYDHVTFPNNVDLPPLSTGDSSRDLVSPKAGLIFEPWKGGLLRASYTKSLGGLYFDNSVRIEPTQVAGFNQAFRSLIPESVAGLVPGTEFETIGVGFDQSLPRGTWFGVEAEQLKSNGERDVGAFSSFAVLPVPQTATTTREKLDFRERSLSAYVGQLIGDNLTIGARYRVSEAKLRELFPDIPDSAIGLDQLESNEHATLQQLSLTANFHHRCGAFAQWETAWYRQSNSGFNPATPGDDFWQQNLTAGYRFPRRSAELRVGVLNLFDTDYRLNPLNLHAELPRSRTFIASLRLNF